MEPNEIESLLRRSGNHNSLFNGRRRIHTEPSEEGNSTTIEVEDVLPINDYEKEIVESVKSHQVVIITGETGSGKSTQLPQILWRNGFLFFNTVTPSLLKEGAIAISQPRRVAAINLARRVSEEMHCAFGEKVGYTVRCYHLHLITRSFDDKSSPATQIKYITDGCLVKEFITDPQLGRYTVIMLDEAHDRSIHTDILFGLCKKLLPQRPELRLIITSATLNTAQFAAFYPGAATLSIPGRLYPVAIYHSKDVPSSNQNEVVEKAVDVLKRIHKREPGHVLLFLPGQYEIEKAVRLIDEWCGDGRGDGRGDGCGDGCGDGRSNDHSNDHSNGLRLRVFPLYAALPAEEQARVFEPVPAGVRKVVVCTNIAETSVTVPGIRFVIDPGFSREKHYNARTGIDGLDTVRISKVAAQQRAGRAGRTGPGKCYRLYSSEVYAQMEESAVPEIRRSSLVATMLYLKVLGVDDVLAFDYLDAPAPEAISVALKQLYILGALDANGAVTELGRQMSALPLDPPLVVENGGREG